MFNPLIGNRVPKQTVMNIASFKRFYQPQEVQRGSRNNKTFDVSISVLLNQISQKVFSSNFNLIAHSILRRCQGRNALKQFLCFFVHFVYRTTINYTVDFLTFHINFKEKKIKKGKKNCLEVK